MSFVTYRCHKCGRKAFNAAGKKNFSCTRGACGGKFRQVTETAAPSFSYHEEDQQVTTRGSRQVQTKGQADRKLRQDKETLQALYIHLTGEKPDGRWKKETLEEQIEKVRAKTTQAERDVEDADAREDAENRIEARDQKRAEEKPTMKTNLGGVA